MLITKGDFQAIQGNAETAVATPLGPGSMIGRPFLGATFLPNILCRPRGALLKPALLCLPGPGLLLRTLRLCRNRRPHKQEGRRGASRSTKLHRYSLYRQAMSSSIAKVPDSTAPRHVTAVGNVIRKNQSRFRHIDSLLSLPTAEKREPNVPITPQVIPQADTSSTAKYLEKSPVTCWFLKWSVICTGLA